METELKSILEKLDPKLLGVEKIKIEFFKKLGIGEGNINYVFKIKDKKFICRINIDKGVPNKSKEEFNALKRVESLKIAPKAYYFHSNDKKFPYGFIILEFIEGKPFRSRKRTYTKKQIKQIAIILAELHSKSYNDLPKKNYSFQYYIKKGEEYNKIINKHSDRLKKGLEEIHNRIKKFLSKREEHKFSLIHGDVCPQNIVETKKELKLIDWESLQCSDPAKDIANVLIDLELKNKNLDLFLKEYHKIRKDPTILERAETYAVLFRYTYFLWEITRSFDIINKELPKEYLNKTTAQSHVNEAKFQFRKLRRLIDMPKININVLFTGAKN
jgi:thiamine kinase-like enzyme